MNTFKIIIRTPEAEVLSKDVESIYIATELGDMMILPEHASFAGVVSFSPLILTNGEHQEQYLIQRGILFFSNNKNEAVILCSRCDTREKLDFHSVKEYLKMIEDKLASGDTADLSEFHYKFLENERVALVQQIEQME